MSARGLSERGAPRELVLLWHEDAFELVVSYDLLFKLQSVLLSQKSLVQPERDVLDYVLWLHENATLKNEGEIRPLSWHPEDDYLLAFARNSGAGYLGLQRFRPTRLEGRRPTHSDPSAPVRRPPPPRR